MRDEAELLAALKAAQSALAELVVSPEPSTSIVHVYVRARAAELACRKAIATAEGR